MKRYILPLIILVAVGAMAQTQQLQNGVVKTRGRMVNGKLVPGDKIANAMVSVRGRTPAKSRDDGTFSFPVTEKTFIIDSVRKKEYALIDFEACRQYSFPQSPFVLLMEKPEKQQAELLAAERKIRRNLQRQLQDREAEIENMRNASQQEKDSLLRLLYQQQGDNERLIADMAKRYSALDYDQLDEFYRQVSYFIENGELTRADSLLRSRGDINAQVKIILQQGQTIQEKEEQLDKAKEVHKKDIDEAARRCYGYYEAFFARHQNDSAAHYLELRSSLDTTSVNYMSDVGHFVSQYLADYKRALYYYERALSNAKKTSGFSSESFIMSMMDIATLYGIQHKNKESINKNKEALSIAKQYFGDSHPIIAKCLMNIAISYTNDEQRDVALDYYKNALSLLCKYYHNDTIHSDIADCYNGIGVVYNQLKQYEKAIEAHEIALKIRQNLNGTNRMKSEISLHNIGMVYMNIGNWNIAIDYITKSLKERISNHGEYHNLTSTELITLGQAYCYVKQFEQALECYNKSLKILNTIYGNKHPKVAHCYSEIGMLFLDQGQAELAISNLNKSAMINSHVYGNDHLTVGLDYNNIGYAFLQMKKYEEAIEAYHRALQILTNHYPPSSSYINNINENISFAKRKLGD